MSRIHVLAGVWFAGCREPAPANPPAVPEETPDVTPIPEPDDIVPPTGETGIPELPPFDCTTVPTGLRPVEPLTDLYASEDFAFDGEGHLISATGTTLVKQEYPPGSVEPFVGTDTDPSSMRMLPTGDLVYANINSHTLFRVQMDGVQVPIVSGFNYATGIDVHPNGKVFIGDASNLKRVDPYTGEQDEFLGDQIDGIINGVTFSEDFSVLYFATRDMIFRLEVDAEGTPLSRPDVFAQVPGGDLLGMGVDVCGNLYALDHGRLLRFAGGGGPPEILMEGGIQTTNLQWGSGLGGWDPMTVYVVDRSSSRPPFSAIAVGVPSKFYW